MKKLPLSLVVITKNEEDNIERCLRSVPFADDLVVVDSGSTDETVILAERHGARVFTEAWRGYGPQKRFAVGKSANDWVLCLDADEALSPELAREIQDRFSGLDERAGYLIPRKSFHLGRWILHGGWYPDYQLRLFNRSYAQWGEEEIHEKVEVERKEKLKEPILHWVFEGVSDQVMTNDKYSSLQARELAKKGKRFSLLKLITKPWSKFMECYFFKGGFRDGLPGFIIAVSAAYSVFLRWSKLWEIEKLPRRDK